MTRCWIFSITVTLKREKARAAQKERLPESKREHRESYPVWVEWRNYSKVLEEAQQPPKIRRLTKCTNQKSLRGLSSWALGVHCTTS